VVLVWKLDRLARSLSQLIDTTALFHECGVELQWLCRKFCSEGHEGAVAPVCGGIKRRGSRTVRPQ
jgi:hypothetical protein